jgi:NADH dehydrogenase
MARVLILGGAGFIGRHAWAALKARGHETVIGTRRPRRAQARLRAAGDRRFREAHFERLTSAAHWDPLLREIDMVVNAVGILRERGAETYERVHCAAPAALAAACARRGIRLIHISALGLHAGARSAFITSKLHGEQAIAASRADYTIVRPSLRAAASRPWTFATLPKPSRRFAIARSRRARSSSAG